MTTKPRSSGLTSIEMYNLDRACEPLHDAFDRYPYLVGSVMEDGGKAAYRDVDVRMILDDNVFDGLFQGRTALWDLLCVAVGDYLRQRTSLPIDFQIQRQSEANECHNKMRNPLGLSRCYAGAGDGTPDWIMRPGR